MQGPSRLPPRSGPWVACPAGRGRLRARRARGAGYIVAGTDARLATRDIDVSFRGETGSPVGPGVTTHRSRPLPRGDSDRAPGPTSFRPFIGCIPVQRRRRPFADRRGRDAAGGIQARHVRCQTVVVTQRVPSRSPRPCRRACPSGARLVGATHALRSVRDAPPSAAVLGGVRVTAHARRRRGPRHASRPTARPSAPSRKCRYVPCAGARRDLRLTAPAAHPRRARCSPSPPTSGSTGGRHVRRSAYPNLAVLAAGRRPLGAGNGTSSPD